MWFVHYMRWIMLASGALTATMVQARITLTPPSRRTSARRSAALWRTLWSAMGERSSPLSAEC